VSNTGSCRILEYVEPVRKVFAGMSEDISEEEMEIVKNLYFITNGIFEILDVKGKLIALKRLQPSYCAICKRDHQNENPYLTM
jgi:hypothetical protein